MTTIGKKGEDNPYIASTCSSLQRLPRKVDTVVIGSGIGGLTCASYLARNGLKVLLVEKHYLPGGCCSSFWRKEYYFDAGAHYLSSCRPDGQVGRLIRDLNLNISLLRNFPSDVIMLGKKKVYLNPRSLEVFSSEFESAFPEEADGIKKFWNYVATTDSNKLYVELRSATFKQVLDSYFTDDYLKEILSVPLGNIGLPASEASALTVIFLYKEYLLDGGYYPKGGMQRFPDAIHEDFRKSGGVSLFLTAATRINVSSSGRLESVDLSSFGRQKHRVEVDSVVVNTDPYHLYNQLMPHCRTNNIENLLSERKPSISCFMIHLGVRRNLNAFTKDLCNVWYYGGRDINRYYTDVLEGRVQYGKDGFVICSIPGFHDRELDPEGRSSIHAMVCVPFKDRVYWKKNKERLATDVLARLDVFLPGVSGCIELKYIATPGTIHKYTNNYMGAMYGWRSSPSTVGREIFGPETELDGVYMVGHWTGVPTGYSGVSTVVASGRRIAREIIRKRKKARISTGALV